MLNFKIANQSDMRYLLSFCFTLFAFVSFAQQMKGKIRDLTSGKLILHASIESSKYNTKSNSQGVFSINITLPNDTLIISAEGYLRKRIPIDESMLDVMLMIDLEDKAIPIEEIVVEKKKEKLDSINRSKVYIPPIKTSILSKIFKDRASYSDLGRSPLLANSSTATLFTINVLALPSLFGLDKKSTTTKKQTLENLQQEREWIDIFYNLNLIEEITGLKGDQAKIFQNSYAPSYEEMQRMSEYDIRAHISKQYKLYLKGENEGIKNLEIKK